MPQPGPDRAPAYLPHEAYSVIGRQLYPSQWVDGYSGQPALPDLHRAKQLLEKSSKRSKGLRQLLAQGDDAYDELQRQRYREAQGINNLLEALRWGKTHAWYRLRRKDWRSVDDGEWGTNQDLRQALVDDVAAYWARAELPSGNLLIDKDRLDLWLPNIVPPLAESPVVAKLPNPTGRPPVHVDVLIAELRFRKRAGQLPEIKRGWREKICRDLRAWYAGQYPDEDTPQAKTIKRLLQSDLDRIEAAAKKG